MVGGLERNPPSICIGTKWSYAAACQRTSERFLWALTKWEYVHFPTARYNLAVALGIPKLSASV